LEESPAKFGFELADESQASACQHVADWKLESGDSNLICVGRWLLMVRSEGASGGRECHNKGGEVYL
jgi:hypothetical protein